MIVINNIDSQRFTFNGVEYYKNFTPIVIGTKIRILNAYDSTIELTDSPRLFSEFEVNGLTYANVNLLQSALLPILYTRNTLGGGGGISAWSELTDFDALNDATLPLSGTEEIPIVQGGETKKVAVSEFGGGTPSLQAVTDIGAVTTNQLTVEDNIITIYDSTTFDEISVSPTQITNVDANSFSTDIKFATKTQNTDFVFEDEGGTKSIATREWVALNGGSNVVTEINTTGTASSGTAETITYSVLIPANTMSIGVYDAITRINKTGTAGIVTVNMYVNNTNDLTTPILIGRSISTSTARYMPLQKFIDIKVLNGTGLGTEVANNANSATFPNDYVQHGNTAGMSNVAIDWTIDQYLIVTVTNASASDSSTGTFLILKK